MKKIKLIALALGLFSFCLISCENPDPDPINDSSNVIKNAVKDVDGNSYDAVKIGDQVWMKTNLRTKHYPDGTPISQGYDRQKTEGYWEYPNGKNTISVESGLLYNWYALMHNEQSSTENPSGVQGICPKGWHVPSDAEWSQLTSYVRNQSQYVFPGTTQKVDMWKTYGIAKAMASNSGWEDSEYEKSPGYNQTANNATGFSAFPVGDGSEYEESKSAFFWSATKKEEIYAYYRFLSYNSGDVGRDYILKCAEYSVRCVRD